MELGAARADFIGLDQRSIGVPRIFFTLLVAGLLSQAAFSTPPSVELSTGGVGLYVPIDNDLMVDTWGVDQFLGNGFLYDGNAARTIVGGSFARFGRYRTAIENQSTVTARSPGQDWAVEIGYKHTGTHSSINNPFVLKNFSNDDRILALFNDGGDSWSLGVGNDSGGYDTAVSDLSLGDGWSRFNFHYKASGQTIDAYLNRKLIAQDLTVGHGQYNLDHVQIEHTGNGQDWFSEIKIGNAVPETRSATFGNEWVRSKPFTVQGLVVRDSALLEPYYREANFSHVLAWENNVGLVDKAWERQQLPWHWHTGKTPLTPMLKATIHQWMAQRPGGEGFLVWDEPQRDDLFATAEVTDWIKDHYPEMLVYGNINTIQRPGTSYANLYGSTPSSPPVPYDFSTFMDDYLHIVEPDVIQFSLYPITDDPTESVDDYLWGRYFTGMEQMRRAAQKADIPYFLFLQSIDGGGWRMPSDSELRFQAFAPLAYGFKGIGYFMFDHFGAFADGNEGGLLRATNQQESTYTTNPIYFDAQALNPELSRLGEALKMMDSTQVRFILGTRTDNGNSVPNQVPLGVDLWNPAIDEPFITNLDVTYHGSIPDVVEGNVLMGHFETADESLDGPLFQDELYFMLVNLLMDPHLDATQEVRIDFDFGETGINSLQRLNRLTGQVDVIPLVHDVGSLYHLDWTLSGGTGDLFKYNTGAPFITGGGIAGDYNRDGVVDAADYTVWQDKVGTSGVPGEVIGDGDDGSMTGTPDGVVDISDYQFWKLQFNLGTASASARAMVPEPDGVLLLLVALAAHLASRNVKPQERDCVTS